MHEAYQLLLEENTALRQRLQELQGSEFSHKMALASAGEGILAAELHTKKFIYANPSLCKMFGHTQEEILHMGLEDIHPKESFGQVLAEFEALMRGEKTWALNIPCLRKNGTLFYVNISTTSLIIVLEGKKCKLGFFTDITERKKSEEALRESEELYRTLIETSPDPIIMYSLKGEMLAVNTQAAKIYGVSSADDFLQEVKTVFDLLTDDSKVYAAANFNRTLAEGSGRPREYLLRDRGGRMITAETHSSIVRTATGEPLAFISVVRDITERKRMERALVNAEKRFLQVMENTGEAVWELDAEGVFQYCSPAMRRIMGYAPEELVGKMRFYDLLSSEEREQIKKNLFKQIKHKKPFQNYVIQKLHSNNDKVTVEISGTPILDEKGDLRGYRGVVMDITERIKTESELNKYRKNLEQLITERTSQLECKTKNLQEVNIALNVLLQRREEDQKNLQENFVANIKELIIPYVEKFRKSKLNAQQLLYLDIIEKHLGEIVSPLLKNLKQFNLTPREHQVASLVKDGKTTKEIAEILMIGKGSIDTHRKSIRKKMGLTKTSNLESRLRSMG